MAEQGADRVSLHGFSTLWLNDAVAADVKAADPMDTVERIARLLFDG